MNMMPSRLLGLLAVTLLAAACPVKEDRDLCPCFLTLDFTSVDSVTVTSVGLLVTAQDGFALSDTLDMVSTGRYLAEVPRDVIHVRAWSGTGALASEEGLIIPSGQDCPLVYMHDSDVKTRQETVCETIIMRKNHCRLTICADGDEFPFDMTVKGNVCGYDAYGMPLSGNFDYRLRPEDTGDCSVVLPRQTDASLLLYIDGGGDDVKCFALGEYIVASGYDWNSPDLEDISVTMDFAMMEVRLIIDGWESVYTYDIVI